MVESLLTSFIEMVVFVGSYLVNVLFQPLFVILDSWFPDFSNYLANFEYFFLNYVCKGVAFAREVFLNCTGFPRALFHAIVTLYLAKLAFRVVLLVFKFIYNIYHAIRGAGGEMVDE